MNFTTSERHYLRELAKKQAEIAALPVMGELLKKWYNLNDGKPDMPLVTAECSNLLDELMPPLKCETPFFRELEKQLTWNITRYNLFRDDRVMPGYVTVVAANSFVPFGITTELMYAQNADGSAGKGFAMKYAIENLERDFDKLRPAVFTVDIGLAKTMARQAEFEEILGDILPVKIQFPSFNFSLGHNLVQLMSMENMFFFIYDYPDLFHKIMASLTGDYFQYMSEIESAGSILCNNDGSDLGQGTWGYTNDLPSAEELNRPVTFKDVWGYTNFQETVGMSAKMFDEFFFSYMERIANRFGLLSYGCCEPVDTILDMILSRLPNLRKLSVSPWCNEDEIANKIRGKKIVYHRKPSANYITSIFGFDEVAFAEHIAKTVIAASGCPLEVSFREELTVCGEPWRFTRAVEIVREQFARYYKA